MNQSQKPQNSIGPMPELDFETIKAIIAQQTQKLQLEGDKIRLEEKRLDQDGKLAAKSLEINSQLLKDYPSQHRKTILTYGGIICFIIIIILGFILYCISQGKTEFADKFLNWLSHIGGIAGGFLFGKLINKKKPAPEASNVAEDAEIVD